MARLFELLGVVWLPGLLLIAGVVLLAVGLRRRSAGRAGAWGGLLLGGGLLALGSGGVTLPDSAGFWIAIVAAVILFANLVWLVVTGQWLAPLAAVLGGV